MKKIISVLVLATVILSSLAIAVSATQSEVGTITIVDIDKYEGSNVAKITPVASESEEWTKAKAPEGLDETYGFFTLTLTDDAKAAGTKEATVTISVPGLTAANSPVVAVYNAEKNAFVAAENIKVNGSEITFKATFTDGVVKCSVLYNEAATSPETGVPAGIVCGVLVIAVLGAAYTGRKAFN